jgi:hypothetical protein
MPVKEVRAGLWHTQRTSQDSTFRRAARPGLEREEMTEALAEHVLEVTVTDRAGFERELEQAERLLLARAIDERRGGILIRRTSYSSFTAEVSGDVPFGLTRQRQDW